MVSDVRVVQLFDGAEDPPIFSAGFHFRRDDPLSDRGKFFWKTWKFCFHSDFSTIFHISTSHGADVSKGMNI